MRYATVVISPDGAGLHPADSALADEPTVERQSISQVSLLSDGSAVLLYRLRGNLQLADSILDSHDEVRDSAVAEGSEGLAYIHLEPNETVRALLTILHENEIIIDPPIGCLPGGGVRSTIVGRSEAIRSAVGDIPDHLTISLESLGDYQPETDHLTSRLTDRQREILDAAVEMGYYEVPRGATHDDIAADVDLSAGTVGEHLRKVEGKVLSELATH